MAKKAARKKATKKKATKRTYTKNPSLYPLAFEDVISVLLHPKKATTK